jgi:SsrA-binding protein
MGAAQGSKRSDKSRDRQISNNRRAHFDYELGERFEAGIVLIGSETRALREGSADITDAWIDIKGGEAFVKQMRIPVLTHAAYGHEEIRVRKLLLHKEQIFKLQTAVERERMTVVVTKAYFKQGRVKIEIALARGRKAHDKRHAIRAREATKEATEAIRNAKR